MGAPQFMIHTVDGFGARDKPLPDFQGLDLSPVFSQAGTVVIKYPENGVNFNLLAEDTELIVTLDGNEVGSLRCIIEQIEGDDANEASNAMVWTFTARTLLALFDRAIVYPKNWPSAGEPSYGYAHVTPGAIIRDQLFNAQDRGSLLGINATFSNLVDSSGTPWPIQIDGISFDAGTKLSAVIQSLVDGGYVEVTMNNRSLSAYALGGLGTDKSTGSNALRFQAGRDVKESPRKISSRDLATTLLVAGSQNVYREMTSSGGIMTQWGRRESYYSLGVSDWPGVIDYYGQQKLSTLNVPLLEVTHGLFFDDDVNPRPITDFNVGDWGLSDVGRGWEKYRIKQWVLSVDQSGEISGSVTLNDLIAEQLAKVNDRLGRLENGVTSPGASEEKDDGKAPAAPTNVQATTDYYVDHDQSRAFVSVTWDPVSTNSDGTAAIDISYYLARWRYVGDSNWQTTQRTDVSTTVAYFADIFPNASVEAQVQTVDKYNRPSAWSISSIITTARDQIAPVKPSAPVVTSNVGTLRMTWSGLDSLGQPQVADFDGVEVHVGTNGSFTPTSATLKDYLKSRTTIATTITGLAYGTDWFVRLVAVDTSGNKSSPSDQTSTSHTVLNQVVNVEIGTGQVGLNNTAFSDVGNLIDDGNFEIASYRVARQALIGSSHLAFDSTIASVGGWSLRSDSFASGAIEYFVIQDQLPVKPGERIFGALDLKATSDAVGVVNLDIAWFNGAGQQIDASGAPASGFYTLAGLASTIKDNTWYSRVTTTSLVAPVTAASMQLIFYTSGRTAGTVWADAIEVRRQVDTLLIGDAAITTAKIANLAVNDAQIGNMNVGKLIAGTLAADITVSARIKTANTGARVELNSSGLQVFNSSNAQTGSFNSADGSISIAGTLVTGFSGSRIEINPSGLPTIRLYSGGGTEFGFINGFTLSGTDVGVGFNSSPFSGNSTQLGSRMVAWPGLASMEVIRSSNQQTSGGYTQVYPSNIESGYSNSGTRQAYMYADSSQFYAASDHVPTSELYLNTSGAQIGSKFGASGENAWAMWADGVTQHFGKWDNFVGVSANTQGIFTGRVSIGSGFSFFTFSYGSTMASAMTAMVTLASTVFDDTTGTNTGSPTYGISGGSGSTTSFTVGYDKGLAVIAHFWCFRA
jgi:hypothetical protein